MKEATFHFHGGLNDFLPRSQRDKPLTYPFDWRASIKDMVESLGPPHSEIELLVVNGESVDFDYIVQPGVRIDVYDDFEAVTLPEKVALRPALEGRPRFVLDTHLGRLASYLRMLGFDTLYRNDYPDDELAYVSNVEQRILLTRDIGLLKRSLVIYGYFMRATHPKQRVLEVMARFDLQTWVIPFKHCMKCNGALHRVEKADILAEISPKTARFYDEYHRCQHCGRIYWKGSHYQRMQSFLAEVLQP